MGSRSIVFTAALFTLCLDSASVTAQQSDDGPTVVLTHAAHRVVSEGSAVLATLEWAPATSEALPGGGSASHVVREAFKAQGVKSEFRFMSWNRAIESAWRGSRKAAAYFPGYHCNHKDGADFVASAPIGGSRLSLVFASGRAGEANWTTLDDLEGVRIGYITGFASTDEIEAREAAGDLTIIRTNSDTANLKNVLRARLDAAIVDRNYFNSLVKSDPELATRAGEFEFAEKPLGMLPLYVCFRRDSHGMALKRKLDAGLAEIDVDRITEDYFAERVALR